MSNTRIYSLRLTPSQYEALLTLFRELKFVEEGQRGAVFNPGMSWLADTADGAMAETVAALEIASGCAAGEDWETLIEAIEPKEKVKMYKLYDCINGCWFSDLEYTREEAEAYLLKNKDHEAVAAGDLYFAPSESGGEYDGDVIELIDLI